jgi:hypothetical protein
MHGFQQSSDGKYSKNDPNFYFGFVESPAYYLCLLLADVCGHNFKISKFPLKINTNN